MARDIAKQIGITMAADSFVDERLLEKVPRWRNYLEAKLGFRNHWYPVKFSNEIAEGEVVKAKLMGEEILLKRVDGKIFAIRDRCLHRGVKLSEKVECYTRSTITCWYHGFTYKWDSGTLCDIIASPKTPIIGKKKLRTYPVEEAKGLVFVFVGDDGLEPHSLSRDVPHFFLDDDMVVFGSSYMVRSNWRLGCENGIDDLHIYLHRQSPLIVNTQRSLPLGHTDRPDDYFELYEDADGPKGVGTRKFRDAKPMAYEGVVEGKVVVTGTKMHASPEEAARKRTTGHFVCLPGVLRVDNFPYVDHVQFEWYVPVSEDEHLYIITIGKRCVTEEERVEHEHQFIHRWKPNALEGFNNEDVFAREALQPFYNNDANWLEEVLVREDHGIVLWRELCHRHSTGVQKPSDIV
ncbi:Rieske 2Fe-2S domain-containing protein [Novosphingobium sp.]|uniref:Rieske 2Fe-2S domain-containing protein n=1 Tax=Novosphingobium sp. TaxID=1874826 RepID=UPI002609D0FA|nr:Rieske 2Fe-2S domain-containing protein [Novosphingobium sp.]